MTNSEATPEAPVVHVAWINGDSVALTAATLPSVEEIAVGTLPGLPGVAVHWPLIARSEERIR